MVKSLLAIPIERFEETRTFACDVFLHLPLNGRYIRLVKAGDQFSPETLARLRQKGLPALFVVSPAEATDPAIFPLYSNPTPEAVPPPPPPEASPTSGASATAATEASPDDAQPVASAVEESIPVEAAAPAAEGETILAASAPELESEMKFEADPPKVEEALVFSADAPTPEEVTILSAQPGPELPVKVLAFSQAIQKAQAQVVSGKIPKIENPEEFFANAATAITVAKISAEISELEVKKIASTNPEEEETILGKIGELGEVLTRIRSAGVAEEEVIRRFGVKEEVDNFRATFSADRAEEAITWVSSRTEKLVDSQPKPEGLMAKRQTAWQEDGESPLAEQKSAAKKLEEALKANKDALNGEIQAELRKQARSAILAQKISQEILAVSPNTGAETEEELRLKAAQMATLEEALVKAEAGEEIPEELERRFSPDKEAEEFVATFSSGDEAYQQTALQRMSEASKARAEAVERLAAARNDSQLLRARTNRDLPSTVSRLSAYLGYALGYTNMNLLTELALASVLHFAGREEGKQLPEGTELPRFVDAVLKSRADEDFVIADAIEIVHLLEAYLDNPQCDRSSRDFVKRIFEQAAKQVDTRHGPIDAINLARWMKFTERGPDLTGHSVCTKASALALKQSKNLTN